MSTDISLAFAIFEALNIVIFKRTGPRQYERYGALPRFYRDSYDAPDGTPCDAPWEHSAMLEFFLEDAEAFFERHERGQIVSGVWQEQGIGDDQSLQAAALATEHDQVLILRLLNEDFKDRRMMLQKAREQLLERRSLSSHLEIYKHKSRYDALTNLHNQATFNELLQKETLRATRQVSPLGLIFLDIDNFKKINDTYGHQAGNVILADLGNLLRANLRQGDLSARYGGEEFAILVPQADCDQAAELAEKIRLLVAAQGHDSLPHITVSVGCACYVPGEPADSFIERADQALYDAKRSGKNRVIVRRA